MFKAAAHIYDQLKAAPMFRVPLLKKCRGRGLALWKVRLLGIEPAQSRVNINVPVDCGIADNQLCQATRFWSEGPGIRRVPLPPFTPIVD